MSPLNKIMNKLFTLPLLVRVRQGKDQYIPLHINNHEVLFTDIYKTKKWGGTKADSVSGPGSDIHQTSAISKELPILFYNLEVKTMLDIPCGDFHWMKNVKLNSLKYTGADIVEALINKNIELHANSDNFFQKLNLIEDKLPKVDLIFCRDCLVHFSYVDIFEALNNICNSHSKYLLTTTFIDRKHNKDITTGNWRPINLELSPFLLPQPLKIINEGCTEGQGAYTDKSLGLWKISDIRKTLAKHRNL